MLILALIAALSGFLLLALVIRDTFETIVLPRSVGREARLAPAFQRLLWGFWSWMVHRTRPDRREGILATFGPLALLLLFVLWATLSVVGFALLQWGLRLPMKVPGNNPFPDLGTYIYGSGVTFFTLGYGDVTPADAAGATIAVIEAGMGFGTLAIVISYLPVIYQAFSRREVSIALLDARAGSPPAAAELLYRHAQADTMPRLTQLLESFERWSAELLESYISYPILAYYRSQHEQQSWLAALTTVLDTCALIQVDFKQEAHWQKELLWQSQLTFALARHVLVDLAYIINAPPVDTPPERLSREEWEDLCTRLGEVEKPLCDNEEDWEKLRKLRAEYEPFVFGLARYLFLSVPPWTARPEALDNWQTSAWDSSGPVPHF